MRKATSFVPEMNFYAILLSLIRIYPKSLRPLHEKENIFLFFLMHFHIFYKKPGLLPPPPKGFILFG